VRIGIPRRISRWRSGGRDEAGLVGDVEPGAVATELPGHNRPEILEAMAKRFQGVTPLAAEDIANAVLYAIRQPANVSVNEVLIRPSGQSG